MKQEIQKALCQGKKWRHQISLNLSPYEDPQSPELKIDTGNLEIDKCVDIVTNLLIKKDYFKNFLVN